MICLAYFESFYLPRDTSFQERNYIFDAFCVKFFGFVRIILKSFAKKKTKYALRK